jgi:pimeloyl-ACP methyl ester carboxylesterase
MPVIGCGGEEEEKKGMPTTPPAAVAPSGFFDSNGVKIHYETWGEGYPIVLVHGFASSLKGNWVDAGWVETLQPVRRVIALDCRGFGESDKPHDAAAYEGDTMPQDVLNLMDYLGIEKAALFGYSMGAFISAALMARHRDRFTSAILGGVGDVFVGLPAEMNRVIADALLAEDSSQITNLTGKLFRAFAELDPNNDLKALAACCGHVGDPIRPADYAGLDIPVLIVNGGNDAVAANVNQTAAGIPGAKLITIPDTDHLTVVPDRRFKDAVLAFLEEQ